MFHLTNQAIRISRKVGRPLSKSLIISGPGIELNTVLQNLSKVPDHNSSNFFREWSISRTAESYVTITGKAISNAKHYSLESTLESPKTDFPRNRTILQRTDLVARIELRSVLLMDKQSPRSGHLSTNGQKSSPRCVRYSETPL